MKNSDVVVYLFGIRYFFFTLNFKYCFRCFLFSYSDSMFHFHSERKSLTPLKKRRKLLHILGYRHTNPLTSEKGIYLIRKLKAAYIL